MCAAEVCGHAGAARPGTTKEGGPAPSGALRISFELRIDKYAELEICIRDDPQHILKKIGIYEVMDKDRNDLAVDLYVNDEFVLRAAEGPETPWFFDREELEEMIREVGEVWAYKQVLGWFTHPVDELVSEI